MNLGNETVIRFNHPILLIVSPTGSLIIFVISILFPSQCGDHKYRPCVTQFFPFELQENFYNLTWKSNPHSPYSLSLSTPTCLDQHEKPVARICHEGAWLTPNNPSCYYIEKNNLCPLQFEEEDKLCFLTTEPQSFQRECPYPGASSAFKKTSTSVWMPYKKPFKHGYYEGFIPGSSYGEKFTFEGDSTFDCLIKENNTIKSTSCEDEYGHICSYNYADFLYRCPSEQCAPSGLGSNYCFCKTLNNNSCTLASATSKHEKDILFKLVDEEICAVSSKMLQFHNPKDLQLAIHKKQFILEETSKIKCAICQLPGRIFEQSDLMLKFNSKNHKLYLHVYSPESLFHNEIYCFTNALDIRKKIKAEEVWDSVKKKQKGRHLRVFKVSISEEGPGNYWCEAFQLPEITKIVSNKVLAYKKFKGHEYSLRLHINNFCRFSSIECRNPSIEFLNKISKTLFYDHFFSQFVRNIRLFHIYDIGGRADLLLHLSVETNIPLIGEYHAIIRNLQRLKRKDVTVIYFRSSLVCIAEYTEFNNLTLYWDFVPNGKIATPDQLCVSSDGVPIRRKCLGDFVFGSQWGKIEGNCSDDFPHSSKTEILFSIASSQDIEVAPRNISELTSEPDDLTIVDLHYLAMVLNRWPLKTDSLELIQDLTEIINNLLSANSTTLKQSQLLLNATDEILDVFENSLCYTNVSTQNLIVLQKDNLTIQITKPFVNNISGLILKDDYQVEPIYSTSNLEEEFGNKTSIEIAVQIPQKLLQTLAENMTEEKQQNLAVITIIYYQPNFFNSKENESVTSKIVSVSIPGFGEYLQSPVKVVFRSSNGNHVQDCAFWNYGTNSEDGRGHWSKLGGDFLGPFGTDDALETCAFSHLTNFALLIRNDYSVEEGNSSILIDVTTERVHDEVLSVISNIGCAFSAFGISGIFLTALFFQSWREKVGTKILIQLCLTILLQIIFLNLANIEVIETTSNAFCIIIGITLHYFTIAEFSWMLVAAFLQFFRFVKVLGPVPNRIILKAVLIGWGLPFIPVVMACAIDLKSYDVRMQGICYPKGVTLYVGVILPIALIIIANFAVFIIVIHNIFELKIDTHGKSKAILKKQIYLAVLLFFLLGIPWIFGLLAELIQDLTISYIFQYVFCVTATLQGFVLFIFYVVLDKATRTLWFTLFKRTCNNKFS